MFCDSDDVNIFENELLEDHRDILQSTTILNDPKVFKKKYGLRKLIEIKHKLERHIYLEEKAVFLYTDLSDKLPKKILDKFTEQHKRLLVEINEAIKHAKTNKFYELDNFINISKEHINSEVETIYKGINECLDKDDRSRILKLINEDAILGYYPLDELREYIKKVKEKVPRT
ncbi:MAG: hypothetical protein GF364_16525 [Candidatus Lokiarchaeota archaeon]|nr:hypothetical protein [Candidatus Lokiarchaeota archaeon]